MKTYLKPFVTGVLLYLILKQLAVSYDAIFVASGLSSNLLIFLPSTVLFLVSIVVPSYVSGWISKDQGTLIGFMVGFTGCNLMFSMVFFSSLVDPFSNTELFIKWFHQVATSSIVGAISGAAGQMHKIIYKTQKQQQDC